MQVRARAGIVVQDAATAEALKPWYNQFCKRPCFHDDYLKTFNRPNVTLVDTDGAGIQEVTETGVVSNGVEYPVDCIVMATGFETGYNAAGMGPQKLGYDIVGRGGQRLSEKWGAADARHGAAEWNGPGPKTFESFHCAGFPNLMMQNAPQGVFTINFVHQLDEGAKHFAHIITQMRKRGLCKFDVKLEEEARYLDRMWALSPVASGRKPGCTPGYYNNEGDLGKKVGRRRAPPYPHLKPLAPWPRLPQPLSIPCLLAHLLAARSLPFVVVRHRPLLAGDAAG
jgi:cyclohexanone monooxygenase